MKHPRGFDPLRINTSFTPQTAEVYWSPRKIGGLQWKALKHLSLTLCEVFIWTETSTHNHRKAFKAMIKILFKMKTTSFLHKFYSVICYRRNIKVTINHFVLGCLFSNQLREVEICQVSFGVRQLNPPCLCKTKMRTHCSSSLLAWKPIFKPWSLSRALAESFQHCHYWQWSGLSFLGNWQSLYSRIFCFPH